MAFKRRPLEVGCTVVCIIRTLSSYRRHSVVEDVQADMLDTSRSRIALVDFEAGVALPVIYIFVWSALEKLESEKKCLNMVVACHSLR